MRMKNLINHLDDETEVVIKHEMQIKDDRKTVVFFQGCAGDVPHSLADYEIFYADAIQIDAGKIVITLGRPQRVRPNMTNAEWLDSLGEVDTILVLLGALYNYDVGTIYYDPANFDNDNEWPEVLEKATNFLEKRLGYIKTDQAIRDWYGELTPYIKEG